jgi:hypothetical protein
VRRVCAVVVNAVGGRKHEDYIRVGLMGFSFFNGLSFLRPDCFVRDIYFFHPTLLSRPTSLLFYPSAILNSGHRKNK